MSNILQGILSVAQLCKIQMMNPSVNNDIVDIIGIIENQIIRGSKLISNVRKLSQLEESTTLIQPTEINSLLKTSINNLKNEYQTHNINIKIHSSYKSVYVQANELLLDVFENVLINAVKHNENLSVEITVKISKKKENKI